MDETQKSAAGSSSSSQQPQARKIDPATIDRLAPVSVKACQKINLALHEAFETWNQCTRQEESERIAQRLQNDSVEKQLEQLKEMQKDKILGLYQLNLQKLITIQEENEYLTRRNSEFSEKLYRLELQNGKIQKNVVVNIQETVKVIFKDFQIREMELASKTEFLEVERKNLIAKITCSEGQIGDLVRNNLALDAKNKRLIELNDENEKRFGDLTRKNQAQEDEIIRLREKLEKATELAREKTEEALQEAIESQRAKATMIKERETANFHAARQQGILMTEMDKYKAGLERDLTDRHERHQKEVDALNAKYNTMKAQCQETISDLILAKEQIEAENKKFKKNFAMMEAQIKGDMKRSLAVNYQEMLNIISSGTARLPSPPRENPFLNAEKENNSRKHRMEKSPSPKKTLGVQTSNASTSGPPPPKARQPENPRRSTKFSSSVKTSGRLPSTSSKK